LRWILARDWVRSSSPLQAIERYRDSGQRRSIDRCEGDAFDTAAVEAIVRAGVAARRG